MLRRAALVLSLAVSACEREGPPRPPREPPRLGLRAPPAGERAAPSQEAPPDVSVLPPAPVARCVARAASAVTPELASALGALEQGSLVEDACRLDLGARHRAPELCGPIASTTLRELCLARAAMALGAPDRCPGALALRGRDPVCVAVAARDGRLCAAAAPTDRPRCLALVTGDRRVCDVADPAFAPACARELAALGALLPRGTRAALPTVEAWLEEPSPSPDATPPRRWELRALRRGAWLDDAGDLWLVDPMRSGPAVAAAVGDEPVLSLRVSALGDVAVSRPAEVTLVMPGSGAMSTREGTARATVTFAALPRGRGDRCALRARIEGSAAGASRVAEVIWDGFVRDVVPAAALR